MTHALGTHLGGVRSLDDLRERCVLRPNDGECWHLRLADGSLPPRGRPHRIWSHIHQCAVSATRLAWELAGKSVPPPSWRIARGCDSWDCVNPAHLVRLTASQAMRRQANRGDFAASWGNEQRQRAAEARRKVTAELRQWLVESPQNGVEAAHGLGITQSRANSIRAEYRRRAPNVFALAIGIRPVQPPARRAA